MRKHNAYRVLLALPLLLLGVACGGGEEAPAAPDPEEVAAPEVDLSQAGTISGTATYNGDDPDTEIDMGADPNCLAAHSGSVYTQMVEADGGNLANVFVYVKGVPGSYNAPSDTVVLDQNGCQYTPHVFGVMKGQSVLIRNSDETLHNIHATPDTNAEFNQGQPFQGMEMEKTFDQVEVMVPFKCDVHPWMSAYMGVLDHPYFAVTGSDGEFSIEGIPAGTYTVETWHEHLGSKTMEVTVTAGETAELALDYDAAG